MYANGRDKDKCSGSHSKRDTSSKPINFYYGKLPYIPHMINYGWLNKAVNSIKPTSVRNNWNNYFKSNIKEVPKKLKNQPCPLFVKIFKFYLVTQPL